MRFMYSTALVIAAPANKPTKFMLPLRSFARVLVSEMTSSRISFHLDTFSERFSSFIVVKLRTCL